MKKSMLFAAISGLAMASAGFVPLAGAADLMPVEEPVQTWTGFHIGIGGGYGSVLHDGSSEVDGGLDFLSGGDADFFVEDDFDDMGDRGGLLTAEVGFDVQLDERFVLGILGDYTWTNFDSNSDITSCTFSEDDFCVASLNRIELDNIFTIAARFGMLSSPTTLWYGLFGWSSASIDARTRVLISEDDDFIDPIDFSAGNDDRVNGFTVGAGVESMLTDYLSLKLEYRFTDLKGFSFDGGDGGPGSGSIIGGGADIDTNVDDTTIQTIRAVLSWRFDLFR